MRAPLAGLTERASPGRSWPNAGRDLRPVGAAAPAIAAFMALLAWLLRWRGGDLPGQLYRIGLFRAKGFTLWDDQWYAGHHTLGYSLLLPVLGALLGATLLGAVSAVVAAWAFDRLVRGWLGDRALFASLWFATGTVVNLAVGRLAFALGLAIGLVALLALARGRPILATGLALLTGLASPVAGAFLALAAGAQVVTVWTGQPRDRARRWVPAFAVSGASLLPVLLFALLFPEGGTFPFTVGAWAAVLGFSLAVWVSVEERVIRVGAVLYSLVALAVFVIATPLGGNLSRLGMCFAAPLVLCGARRPRRLAGVALLGGLLWWQWSPAWDAIFFGAGRDPSAEPSYYTDLLGYLSHQHPPMRIEIPVTRHHWEVYRVAPTVGLARGWERQLDIANNDLFYQASFSPSAYGAWLRDNAVSFVALPDVSLDQSSLAESQALRAGLPGLTRVWSDSHWVVWRVQGALPLVSGPARLAKLDANSFTLSAKPGDAVVRVRYTSDWQIAAGVACVGPASDGWTMVRVLAAGRVSVHITLPFGTRPEPCTIR